MADRIADQMRVGLKDRILRTTKTKADDYAGNRSKGATRIIFIPWDQHEGQEWTSKCADWSAEYAKKGKTLHVVNYGDNSDFLRNASSDPEATIYIRGHGSPSSPYIGTRDTALSGALTETKLPVEEACRRLMATGLSPTFPGVIKFFFCFSGTVFVDFKGEGKRILDKWESDTAMHKANNMNHLIKPKPLLPRNKSLARAGADFLRNKGFNRCIFYGYLGPLKSVMSDNPKDFEDVNDGQTHKQVLLHSDLVGWRPAAVGTNTKVRASAGRIRV